MNLRVRAALVAAACVVVLTGCVKVDADLKVSSDETVSGKMLLGVDKKLATSTGQSIEKVRESIEKQLKETTTDGVQCTPFEDDKWVGSECQLNDVPFSEMAGGDSGMKLEKNGDRFTIAAGNAGEEIPDMPAGTPAADVKFKITMPGKIIEHDDGAKVDGRSATYTDVSKIGGIRLVSEGSGGGFPVWAIILVAVLLLAAVGAGVFFVLRGRKPAGGGGQFPGQQWGGPGQGQQPGQWGQPGPGQGPQQWGQPGQQPPGQQPGQWGQPGQQPQGPPQQHPGQQPPQQWGQPGQQPPQGPPQGPQQPGPQQPGQQPGQPGQQPPQGPPQGPRPQQPGQQPPQWGQQPPQEPGQWGRPGPQGPGGPPR